MAFPLGKVLHGDMEAAQADLPMLRLCSITGNEQADPQEDIRRETIEGGGWLVSNRETAPGPAFIREAQRLGVADVNDPENTVYIPAEDVQVKGLHPAKKREHGLRAARWALARIYGMKEIQWQPSELVSAVPQLPHGHLGSSRKRGSPRRFDHPGVCKNLGGGWQSPSRIPPDRGGQTRR